MNYAELQRLVVAARIADVHALRAKGLSMRAIANELGISVGQVHADCHSESPAGVFDDAIRGQLWETSADASEFAEVSDFDAFVRQAAARRDLDDEEPQGTTSSNLPADPAPSSSQQMDDWIRGKPKGGITITGRHPGDDFLHDLADRTEAARRRRTATNLQGDTP